MEIDDLDLFIIQEMYNSYKNKLECNTWEMAKKYTNRTKMDLHEFQRACDNVHKTIKIRLKKFIGYNLVIITPNGVKNIYTLILDNVKILRHKFMRKEYNCIALKINDKWVILSL